MLRFNAPPFTYRPLITLTWLASTILAGVLCLPCCNGGRATTVWCHSNRIEGGALGAT